MVTATQAQQEYMATHIDDDRRHLYIATNSAMLVAAVIAFALRFVSRRLGGVKLGLDDWFMVIGAVSSIQSI